MCRVLVVSRSGFYDWLVKQDKPRLLKHRQQQIDAHIAHAFNADKGRSGAIRVMLALDKKGIHYNRKTVALSLQRQGLRARAARKFKATTQSKHNLPVADNLLKQDFTASQPNQKWAGDISYIWTTEGWLYLAVVIVLFSRRVVGWAVSDRMKKDLAIRALEMAINLRQPPKGCIFHSDRGSQYCSYDFQKTLQAHGLRPSMSGKGNCYDNAAVETFFKSLKAEVLWRQTWPTRRQAETAIFQYINGFYNPRRRHSYLGGISPLAFEVKVA